MTPKLLFFLFKTLKSFRPIILNVSLMVILYVNIKMRDAVIILLFSNKSTKFFVNILTFFLRSISVFFYMASLFLNVYWFLRILKPALLPHAKTQNPGVIAYLPVNYTTIRISLCTGLAVYNQVKKLTMGECASVPSQKKSAAHRRFGVLQIVFSLYTRRI